MISKKTKYALHALIYLAKEYNRGPVLISELARKEKMPQKFLESILLDLKNHGLLQSKRGKGGGYLLGKGPNTITLGQIMRMFDGPLAPVSCVSQSAYHRCHECKNEQHCPIRLVMKEVRGAMSKILDQTTLADMIEKSEHSLNKDMMAFHI